VTLKLTIPALQRSVEDEPSFFLSLFQILWTKSAFLMFFPLSNPNLRRLPMFARNVSITLKPNTLNDFNQTFEKVIVPMLRKQAGFRDVLALGDDSTHVTAISLWDSKEQAEAYNTNAYPAVLKTLDKFLDGAPKVRVSSVIICTLHPTSASVVAA
jgi:quinol monooxygenase YgiN